MLMVINAVVKVIMCSETVREKTGGIFSTTCYPQEGQ